jgi:8-oxo-dGTP diphosphatase
MDEYSYVVNVDGVVVRGEQYLLIERAEQEDHAPGLLSFPGGKIEQPPGNSDVIEATARRELSEEVGITVGDVEYITSQTFETADGTQCLNIVTLCDHEGGKPFPRATDEVAAVHWLTADEIKQRDPLAFSSDTSIRSRSTASSSRRHGSCWSDSITYRFPPHVSYSCPFAQSSGGGVIAAPQHGLRSSQATLVTGTP